MVNRLYLGYRIFFATYMVCILSFNWVRMTFIILTIDYSLYFTHNVYILSGLWINCKFHYKNTFIHAKLPTILLVQFKFVIGHVTKKFLTEFSKRRIPKLLLCLALILIIINHPISKKHQYTLAKSFKKTPRIIHNDVDELLFDLGTRPHRVRSKIILTIKHSNYMYLG